MVLDPFEECRARIAVPGSSHYYSTLFLAPEQRLALHALFAFHDEVTRIPRACSEAEVARLKLGWWREELGRAFRGAGSAHPVAAALAALGERQSFDVGELLAFLDAAEAEIGPGEPASLEVLEAQALHLHGRVWQCAAELCGYTIAETPRSIAMVGGLIGLAEGFQDLRSEARRGRVRLPANAMVGAGVPASDLTASHTSAALQRLCAAHIEFLSLRLRAALEAVPRADRVRQLHALVSARIALATLAEVRRDGCHLLEHRIALTPIRKLWIALRTRYAARPGSR